MKIIICRYEQIPHNLVLIIDYNKQRLSKHIAKLPNEAEELSLAFRAAADWIKEIPPTDEHDVSYEHKFVGGRQHFPKCKRCNTYVDNYY